MTIHAPKPLKQLDELVVKGKRVFVRVDFNVPIQNGRVTDELRIAAALPTINYLLKHGAIVILASHLGRPDGKRVEKYSLEPVAISLSELLGREVVFIHDCVGKKVKDRVMQLVPGQVALLENLRYHDDEEANGATFAKHLSELGEVYVDDAFAVAHRAHASVVGVPKYLPHAAGKLIEAEVMTLSSLLKKPAHPFVAIIGGAKIADKIDFMHNLIAQANTIIIGGAMANTFLAAQGHNMQASVLDKGGQKTALDILKAAERNHVKIVLPLDVVVASRPENGAKHRTVMVGQLEHGDMALDLGPLTSTEINTALHGAKTVFWNGTLGFTEVKTFQKASRNLAEHLAKTHAKTIIGGGDTAGFVDEIGMHNDFDFISTGGGAALELLAGKTLPALVPLYK